MVNANAKTVSDIMSTDLKTLPPNAPLQDAIDMFDKYGIRHIPIVDENTQLAGLISDRDLRSAKMIIDFLAQDGNEQQSNNRVQVHEVMTENPLTVQSDLHIQEAAALMVSNKINVLPVIDGHNLKGVVTSTDLLALLTD